MALRGEWPFLPAREVISEGEIVSVLRRGFTRSFAYLSSCEGGRPDLPWGVSRDSPEGRESGLRRGLC